MCHSLNQLTSVIILYCFSILNHIIVESATFYVDRDATPGGSGSSWLTALIHLEDALNRASSGDLIYLRGDRIYIPNTSNREQCFNVPQGISIYGGFRGVETSHTERSTDASQFEQYESIISGNIGDTNTNLDNCYHVLKYNKEIILDRIVVAWGNANFEYNGPEMRGKLNGFGSALITNDILAKQNIIITNSIFKNNEALSGGALFFGSSSNLTSSIENHVNIEIINCVFKDNNAIHGLFEGGYGGAIYAYNNVILTITQTIFQNNYAEFRGGAIYQDYGGKLTCNNCEFNQNQVNGFGGAIFSENRYSIDGTFVRLGQNTIFNSQSAKVYGGGIVILNKVTGIFKDTTFTNNIAGVNGNDGNDGFGGATANFWSNQTEININYNQNKAINNADSNDNYNEQELIFNEIDPNLNINLDEKMREIWDLYQQDTNGIDIFVDSLQSICYVNNIHSGTQNGNSWTTPYNNIQNCLDLLSTRGGEIWVVGNGENKPYKPSIIPPIKQGLSADIHKSFVLYNNVHVYGGFSGVETVRSDRNFHENPTYLSGDIGNNELVNNLIMAADGSLIDGFYMINAGCSSNPMEAYIGGGIFATGVEFNIANSIFYKLCANRVGGAIFCVGKPDAIIEPKIYNTMFIGNTASLDGGAIYGTTQCNIQCKYCNFERNSASRRGGAVYLHGNSDAYFDLSSFTFNYALDSGGCVAVEEISNATFNCNTFANNSAKWEGGCLYAATGTEIQRHIEPLFQGFIVNGVSFNHVFQKNFLINGNFDKGQPDIYLWPYTDFIFNFVSKCDATGPVTVTTYDPTVYITPQPTSTTEITPPPAPTPPLPTTHRPTYPTPYPTQPTPYPTLPTPYPTQPTPYPTLPTPYPTQPTPYPTQPTPYPTLPTPYPTQPTPYPTYTPYPTNPITPYPVHTPYPTQPMTPYPTPRMTPYPTPRMTPYPTPRMTPYPTKYPTQRPVTDPPLDLTCCECTRTSRTPGCPQDPTCAKRVCDDFGMGRCCTYAWGISCAERAIGECSGYDTCCGCLYATIATGCAQDTVCQNTVCDKDPFCCNNSWDEYCVWKAHAVCKPNVNIPICCGCTHRSLSGGCSHDIECEAEICGMDPFCCENRWDYSCAKQAATKCRIGA